jgi:hypothetical protein
MDPPFPIAIVIRSGRYSHAEEVVFNKTYYWFSVSMLISTTFEGIRTLLDFHQPN